MYRNYLKILVSFHGFLCESHMYLSRLKLSRIITNVCTTTDQNFITIKLIV